MEKKIGRGGENIDSKKKRKSLIKVTSDGVDK